MMTRDDMAALFGIGVAAADPQRGVRDALTTAPLPTHARLFVLGLGKAAVAMTGAALEVLRRPARALVVTNYENDAALDGAQVMAAGHPVPDENGLRAAQAAEAMLAEAGRDDHVLVLVSGGGSALLPAPVEGLSLRDKAEVNRVLLAGGMDIVAMNAVRQHLSRLKGGGLLRAAHPAPVTALILSDVIGDDLRAIASGPTVAPIAPRAHVVEMLRASGMWTRLPEAAQAALLRPEEEVPAMGAENRLIGSNRQSLEAMAQARPEARIVSTALVGDVADAAEVIVRTAREGACSLALFGGETTVTLTGTGLGGRNQDLALRVAIALDGQTGWRFLSAGTDGRDGPTEAAGAIVDGATCARIRAAGGDPQALLANNDSNRALALSGDLLVTGGTGTNVADLQILSLAR
ncbi:MAG: glycerate kinase [Roseinatronobacter sp.]